MQTWWNPGKWSVILKLVCKAWNKLVPLSSAPSQQQLMMGSWRGRGGLLISTSFQHFRLSVGQVLNKLLAVCCLSLKPNWSVGSMGILISTSTVQYFDYLSARP